MAGKKGILLTTDYRLVVKNGTLRIGSTADQEAVIVMQLNQCDLKEDLLLGPGLTKYMRSKYKASQIDQRLQVHFSRAGLNYEEFKERITINNNA